MRNDFPSQCMILGNINPVVVPNESSLQFHAAVMVDGTWNCIVPQMNVSGHVFDMLMSFFNHGHDHGFEMFGGKNYNLVIIFLSLIMILLVD